jgi:hypothetical protein
VGFEIGVASARQHSGVVLVGEDKEDVWRLPGKCGEGKAERRGGGEN